MRPIILAAAAALLVSGCGEPPASSAVDVAEPAPQATVIRETPSDPEPPAFQPVATTVIQSQPGPKGSRVDLTRVAVTGDVMTVQASFSHSESTALSMAVDEVAVIDDATAQRYGVLKDGGGKFMAAPMAGDKRLTVYASGNKPEVLWFKFPAPPATSPTVSINIPTVGPFDGVPVARR